MKEKSAVQLVLKDLRIYKDKLLVILKIGLPAGIQGSLFALSNVVIQSAINSFGNIVIAGNSAAANLEGYVYVSMNAFHQATISFIGTPASHNDNVEPQTEPCEVEPFEERTSETTRIV